MYFENEVEPGVLQPSIQKHAICKKIHTTRTESTHNQLPNQNYVAFCVEL